MRPDKLFGRRQLLVATGAATTCVLTPLAATAAAQQVVKAVGGANTGRQGTIKGVVREKPVHGPLSKEQVVAGYSFDLGGTAGEGSDGPPPGMVRSPNAAPVVYVENGKYLAGKSRADAVAAGKTGDSFASGLRISSKNGDIGGVGVTGCGPEYVIADAVIDLDANGSGLGGLASGVSAENYAALVIRNCTITTRGENRCATSADSYGILKVYNSTLTAQGAPFTPDKTNTAQKRTLEIDGNSRCTVVQDNGYAYYYYSTIVSEGWAALSMDISNGFAYLEANHCTVKTIKSGYGTYADFGCHNYINSCDFDVADMAGIMSGEADLTFTDTKAKCGAYFVLVHCIGLPYEVSKLKVTGGEIHCKSAGLLVKSANVDILFDGVDLISGSGVLLQSATNDDPLAARAANTKWQDVYGIHATFKNMDVSGDVIHTADKDHRGMTVYLEATTLKGAIKDAAISLDKNSKWVATADSNVIIAGEVDVSQIDAPAGVTITAVAGQSGVYKLASRGVLILKAI